ncbi:MAG: uracil-DNA glycosylase [Candidatus Freyarchaeota archaeon]
MSEDPLVEQLAGKTSLEEVRKIAKECVRCPLSETRTNVVFGEGDPHARIMFVGEAPGEQEDIKGRPFVGRAGRFLDHMLRVAGLERSMVYISNVVKCRPPNNRNPRKTEIEKCNPYLQKQIQLINPRIICILGNVALKTLLGKTPPISELRGKPIEREGIIYFPTFHPAAALYRPAAKTEMEKDMAALRELLEKMGIVA